MKESHETVVAMLQQIGEQVASAPEGGERGVYYQASEWFYDVELSDEDIEFAARALQALATKYEIKKPPASRGAGG